MWKKIITLTFVVLTAITANAQNSFLRTTEGESFFVYGDLGFNLTDGNFEFGWSGISSNAGIGLSHNNQFYISLGIGIDEWDRGSDSHYKSRDDGNYYNEMINTKKSTVSLLLRGKYYFSTNPTRFFALASIGYTLKTDPIVYRYGTHNNAINSSIAIGNTGLFFGVGGGIRIKDIVDISTELSLRNDNKAVVDVGTQYPRISNSDNLVFVLKLNTSFYLWSKKIK